MSEVPNWIAPGKKAYIATGGPSARQWLHEVEIERLTRTQIILTSGEKFRISDQKEIGPHEAWRSTPRLLDPESEEAKKIRQDSKLENLRTAAWTAMDKLMRDASSRKAAERVLDRVQRALDEGAYGE